MDQQLVCEIISKANSIIQHDIVFDMRKRMNTHYSDADKKLEQDLHDTHQKIAWDEVKLYFLEMRGDIFEYRQIATNKEQTIIDSILDVIDNEINEILLED